MSVASFWQGAWQKLRELDYSSWYSLASGLLIGVWLIIRGFVFKHLVYPHILKRMPLVGVATRLQALLVVIYFLVNLFPALPLHMFGSGSDRARLAANMALANIIPLLCGPRLSLVTRLLGISLRTSAGSHRWIGRMAVAQVSLHTFMSLAGFAWTTPTLFGVVGSACFGAVLLLSIGIVRVAWYEWFLNSHTALSVAILIVLWRHVPPRRPASVFLGVGVGVWAATTAVHWCLFAVRNYAPGRAFARAVATRIVNKDPSNHEMVESSDVLRLDVSVPRPWRIKAGQSILLSIPRLGVLTGFRGHPFTISWWRRDGNGLTLSLLVQSRAGFTAELDRRRKRSLLAFVDGPYNAPHDLGGYGTVIMLASGIGIAGHMPYIKELIHGYNSCEVKTRRVLVVWQLDEEWNEQWVQGWMQEAMDNDTGYVQQPHPRAQDIADNVPDLGNLDAHSWCPG